MKLDFRKIVQLWSQPVPDGDAGIAKFGTAYADPLIVNGAVMTLSALVARARAQQGTFADLDATVLEQVDTPTLTTVVFRMRGRHVGPLATPLGTVAPTGKVVERQIIDVLAHGEDGIITKVWMVADDLGALVQLGALALA